MNQTTTKKRCGKNNKIVDRTARDFLTMVLARKIHQSIADEKILEKSENFQREIQPLL